MKTVYKESYNYHWLHWWETRPFQKSWPKQSCLLTAFQHGTESFTFAIRQEKEIRRDDWEGRNISVLVDRWHGRLCPKSELTERLLRLETITEKLSVPAEVWSFIKTLLSCPPVPHSLYLDISSLLKGCWFLLRPTPSTYKYLWIPKSQTVGQTKFRIVSKPQMFLYTSRIFPSGKVIFFFDGGGGLQIARNSFSCTSLKSLKWSQLCPYYSVI